MTKWVTYFAVLLVVTGCQMVDTDGGPGDPSLDQIIIVDTRNLGEVEKDPFQVVSSSISGDVLHLTLSYGGGCEEHDILFYSEGPVLESFPPGAMIRIFHDSHGDLCRALIHESFDVDLTPIRTKDADEVVVFVLHFDHSETSRVRYTY